MRYVVSGARPHSTIIDELDIEAPDESAAARQFYFETETLPDYVETVEDGEVTSSRGIDGWCCACDGPIFVDQDWFRPGASPELMEHGQMEDCEEIHE